MYSAQLKKYIHKLQGRLLLILGVLCLFMVCLAVSPRLLYAQTPAAATSVSQSDSSTFNLFSFLSFLTPNVSSDVPANQHTFVQALMLETGSTIMCQLSGIDFVDPQKPCLTIDPVNHNISYAKSDGTHVGGLIGAMSGMIAGMYTPLMSTSEYMHYVADNFGLVKHAYAADGYAQLSPLLPIWKTFRNISYLLFILAFIFIGLGIMMRIHIDPRTVMTVQNQIPRIITAIVLITFSYAIAGFMVDLMWLTTYAGIDLLTAQYNPEINGCPQPGPNGVSFNNTLRYRAVYGINNTPFGYLNTVMQYNCTGSPWDSGLVSTTGAVVDGIGSTLSSVIDSVIGADNSKGCNPFDPGNFAPGNCLTGALFMALKTSWMLNLVVFIIVLVALGRIWFELLKAYVVTLIYVISAPLWIVVGLLPGKPLGFERWLRSLFATMATFPMMAFIFVLARILADLFNGNTQGKFIPPLVGNPFSHDFGGLLVLGLLFIAPTLTSQLRDAMKVKGTNPGAAIAGGLAAGAAAPRGAVSSFWRRAAHPAQYPGQEPGPIHQVVEAILPERWKRPYRSFFSRPGGGGH